MGSHSHSSYPKQVRLAFMIGMIGAIVLVVMIGSTEKHRLNQALGGVSMAPHQSQPNPKSN